MSLTFSVWDIVLGVLALAVVLGVMILICWFASWIER